MIFENGPRSYAELLERKAPRTCNTIWKALPIVSIARPAKHDEEIFIRTALGFLKPEDGREEFSEELMYSPEKQSICILFGKKCKICELGNCTAFAKLTEGIDALRKLREDLLVSRRVEKVVLKRFT